MPEIVTKNTLKQTLRKGDGKEAVALLYARYGPMLYGYILKFVPAQKDAEKILVNLFAKLPGQMEEACSSPLSIYSWLQGRARELVLIHNHVRHENATFTECMAMLADAPAILQETFMEIYLKGRSRTEVAAMQQTTEAEVAKNLFAALSIIRKKLS
ncbi:RNA polymerase sigma factor [Taibaiella soli]|uniref:RNA polymerase sigma factor n=1 Tax=Taibaiella soli TaxID=1649169 RepID=UPI000F4D6775|nr:sigma-70 family RNA polymerase sigma factor [Taibaiella soli]